MPATKYVARLNGEIVGKRSTKARTYTHAIIVQPVEEVARKAAYDYKADAGDRRNFDYYTGVVEQGVNHPHVRVETWRAEPDHKAIADAKAHIEGGFESYASRLRARMIERFETSLANGGFKPRVAAWAGRLDLAHKAVSQHTSERCKLVAIVPAEVV